jgi:hypothetical protein
MRYTLTENHFRAGAGWAAGFGFFAAGLGAGADVCATDNCEKATTNVNANIHSDLGLILFIP